MSDISKVQLNKTGENPASSNYKAEIAQNFASLTSDGASEQQEKLTDKFTEKQKQFMEERTKYFQKHAYAIQPYMREGAYYDAFKSYEMAIKNINFNSKGFLENLRKTDPTVSTLGWMMLKLMYVKQDIQSATSELQKAIQTTKMTPELKQQHLKELENLKFLQRQYDKFRHEIFKTVAGKENFLIALTKFNNPGEFNLYYEFFDFPDVVSQLKTYTNKEIKFSVDFNDRLKNL